MTMTISSSVQINKHSSSLAITASLTLGTGCSQAVASYLGVNKFPVAL
jgi:hypothetical protein